MYTFARGVCCFLSDFEIVMAVLGVGRGPNGFVAPYRFRILDSQSESRIWVQFLSIFMIFDFSPKVVMAPGMVVTRFSGRSSHNRILDSSCRFQTVERRKVMQIRCGITQEMLQCTSS